jgi:hypothetical protein
MMPGRGYSHQLGWPGTSLGQHFCGALLAQCPPSASRNIATILSVSDTVIGRKMTGMVFVS